MGKPVYSLASVFDWKGDFFGNILNPSSWRSWKKCIIKAQQKLLHGIHHYIYRLYIEKSFECNTNTRRPVLSLLIIKISGRCWQLSRPSEPVFQSCLYKMMCSFCPPQQELETFLHTPQSKFSAPVLTRNVIFTETNHGPWELLLSELGHGN